MESDDFYIDSLHQLPKSMNSDSSMSEPEFQDGAWSEKEDKHNSSYNRMLEIKLKVAESTGTMDTDRSEEVPDFDEKFCGELPCPLLYFDRKSCSFSQIKTFDELSKYVDTPQKGQHIGRSVLQTIVSAPAKRLVRFATLGKYLRNLYKMNKLTDICFDVNGAIFMAHRIALCCCSEYFANLLTKEKFPNIPIHVKLIGISAEAFSAFLEFVYTGEITVQHENVADMVLLSEYLEVKSLQNWLETVPSNLTIGEAVKLLLRRTHEPPDKLFNASIAKVTDQFMSASMLAGFLELDVETFCCLLRSDNLHVSHEMEVFQVALRWIVHGAKARLQYVTMVMNNVRFCHMSQSDLFKCLAETKLFLDYTELRDLILIANWIMTAMILNRDDPFLFEVPPPRRYYIKQAQLETATISRSTRPSKVSDTASGVWIPKESLSPGRYDKSLLVSAEITTSPWIPKLPKPQETTSTRSPVSEKYGKPVIIQPELRKSTFSPSYGKSDVNQTEKRKHLTHRRAMSPAGHAKPTIWPPNANQSSNTTPDGKEVLPDSPTTSLQYQEVPIRPAVHTESPSLRPSSTTSKRFDTNETLRHVTSETTKVTHKERDTSNMFQRHSPRQIGQRYAIPAGPSRSSRPIMLPTEVRTVPDVQRVPEVPKYYFPGTDIIVVGSFEEKWISGDGEERQNDKTRRMIQYCNLLVPRRYFAVAMETDNMYVTGGYNPTHDESGPGVTKTVARRDCGNKKWTSLEPMLEARMCHCACAVEKKVYVFGGLDKNERPLSSCEQFNTDTSQWSTVVPLPVPLYAGAAASLGGKCYIAGGMARTGMDDSLRLVMTMACFDPKSNSWSCKGYLRMPVCHASLVNVQGRLYLCGGATQRKSGRKLELQSVGVIDEYNLLNNCWNFRTEMSTPRHEACVAVAGSRLYVIGGKNSKDDKVVRSVECYDSRDSVWIKCSHEMPSSARWINCVTYKNNKDN